mgnify:CR=1 FL=1
MTFMKDWPEPVQNLILLIVIPIGMVLYPLIGTFMFLRLAVVAWFPFFLFERGGARKGADRATVVARLMTAPLCLGLLLMLFHYLETLGRGY